MNPEAFLSLKPIHDGIGVSIIKIAQTSGTPATLTHELCFAPFALIIKAQTSSPLHTLLIPMGIRLVPKASENRYCLLTTSSLFKVCSRKSALIKTTNQASSCSLATGLLDPKIRPLVGIIKKPQFRHELLLADNDIFERPNTPVSELRFVYLYTVRIKLIIHN